MKVTIVFSICNLVASLTIISAKSLDGFRELVKRRLPHHVSLFSFEFMDGPGDSFSVSDSRNRQGGIDIKCTLASTCARGIYECVCHFRAAGNQKFLPHRLTITALLDI